ncbi:hypothetical protein K435DRAFT_803312 [Dendrothele bispora CBS 962.96]|uniref:Uncharacterized protein n=1 Tax=Dendrothele bispora (strain CBS 962.96) TaxID=1314807 RepID=A0A4S8LHU2_DENBC|nr:hypothetical protein K435DRAFT_803312 [Dendrothele bispora CBS 962.96]
MSFLVAYASLASTAPNHEKEKGKGENYEERHKTRLQTPSVPDSDEVGQTHESIFNGCVDLIRSFIYLLPCSSAHYCESPQNRGKCKEGEYEKESNGPNDLKGNHCKHIFFIFTKLLQVPLGSGTVVLKSSEIKGKSLDKDLYYERPFEFTRSVNTFQLQRRKTSKIKKSPRRILKIEKGTRKKFRLVHRMREAEILQREL